MDNSVSVSEMYTDTKGTSYEVKVGRSKYGKCFYDRDKDYTGLIYDKTPTAEQFSANEQERIITEAHRLAKVLRSV